MIFFSQQDCEKQVVDSPVEQASNQAWQPQHRPAYMPQAQIAYFRPPPTLEKGDLALQMMNIYATEIVPKLETALEESREENRRLQEQNRQLQAQLQRIIDAVNHGRIID